MIALFALIILVVILFLFLRKPKTKVLFPGDVPPAWRKILNEKVSFYRQLKPDEKTQFEERIQHFLNTTRITGIKIAVSLEDQLLVGASAIIPVFAFPNWEYRNLNEVLLYPSSFDEQFQVGGQDKRILGMVGSGVMNGKMILSRTALHSGFENERDKKNVGIHEFVHLIDGLDGQTDGVPNVLLKQPYTIPWLKLVKENMELIHQGDSDFNPYGGVNPQEFYSVISEYFFERPKLLEQKHPKLYAQLSEIFATDLSSTYEHINLSRETGRNDPCPCGSGEKFKHCCGKVV